MKHIQSVHEGETYSRSICEYKARWKESLRNHIQSVHGDERYYCKICDYNTKWKGDLQKHIKSKHEISDSKRESAEEYFEIEMDDVKVKA